jgi:hypothetical protein
MNTIRFVCLIFIFAAAAAGCASKKKSQDENLRRAYVAGAQAAREQIMQGQVQEPQMHMAPTSDPQVRILGPVRNPVLPWTDGMTLGRALVQAQYQRNNTPSVITIYRNNQPLQIDPQTLLNGADYPLFPGDMVYLQD